LDTEQRASAHFLRSASAHEDAAAELAPALAQASRALANALLQDGRIFTAGSGGMNHSARHMVYLLMTRFQRERPPLPAITLGVEPQQLSSVDLEFSRELRTLARQSDALVLMTGTMSLADFGETLASATDIGLPVVLLANQDESEYLRELPFQDIIYIPAATGSAALCQELHMTTIHALCDLIDLQIFGEEL